MTSNPRPFAPVFPRGSLTAFLAACAALPTAIHAADESPPLPDALFRQPGSVAPLTAPAAPAPPPATFTPGQESRVISSITIEIVGRRLRTTTSTGTGTAAALPPLDLDADDPDVAAIRSRLRLLKGEPFSQTDADLSIKSLYETGFYEFVGITPEILPDGSGISVRVKIVPRLRVTAVNFEGNTEWESISKYGFFSALADEATIRPGNVLSDLEIKRTLVKLRKKYDEKFPYATIEPIVKRNEEEGTATVTFKITEREKVEINKLRFEGNYRMKDSLLRPEIETSSYALFFDVDDFPGTRFLKFSWLTDRGRLHREMLREDIGKLREYYRSQGFLDVSIPEETVREQIVKSDGKNAQLDLTFRISEGRRYTIGEIKIEGNTYGSLRAGETRENIEFWREDEIASLNTGTLLDLVATHRNDTTHPYPIGTAPIGSYVLDELIPELGNGPRLERRKQDERRRTLLSEQKYASKDEQDENTGKLARIEKRIAELDARILKLDRDYEDAAKKIEAKNKKNAPPPAVAQPGQPEYVKQKQKPAPGSDELREQIITELEKKGYSTGEIAEIFTAREDQISLQPGEYYSVKAVEKAIEKIRDQYGQHGYLYTYVEVIRRPDYQTGRVNLTFRVYEGTKTHLAAINIIGNNKTRNRVITRELLLEPGDVFDTRRMKNAEMTLRNTKFFDPMAQGGVTLSPETPNSNLPHYKDLKIEVKEGQTGSVSFGAGFSTVERLYGYAEFSESNFDIFNWRNKFRGAGQKFRVRVQIGELSRSIEQSFDEPWVGGRELALGYNAYLRNDRTVSSDWEEQRLGIDVNARRRVYELVYANLGYSIQEVDLRNVSGYSPDFIREEAGTKSLISKATLTLRRDNRNDYYFPTYGNAFSLSQSIAGGLLGGDVNYYKMEAKATQWLPLFDAAEQTLILHASAGAMVHYGQGREKTVWYEGNPYRVPLPPIPFYEKFRLGGAYTMRGFKYAHVGPFDPTGTEPMGGKTYAFFSAEYNIKLFEQLRFAIFYDWGFLNSGAFDFNANGYNDDVGFGFRLLVMGAVMRIDVGWPLTTSKWNDDGVRFNFSFGANW
jgi:outer membrane protein assembly factor BamA